MKPALTLVRAMVVVLGGSAARSKPASIQGVWKVVEVTMGGPGGQTFSHPRPGLVILTSKHYSRTEEHSESPRPTLVNSATASADELRAAWGSFHGEAGTYEIGGARITLRSMVARNPAAMMAGAYSVSSYELSGNTLTVSLLSNERGPVSTPVTIKLTRRGGTKPAAGAACSAARAQLRLTTVRHGR